MRAVDVPQANSLDLVLDAIALISQGINAKSAMAKQMMVAPREADYYAHAARILGFVERRGSRWAVTQQGLALLAVTRHSDRERLISGAIEKTPLIQRLRAEVPPEELSKASISEFLRRNTPLTGATLGRRADTLLAWMKAVLPYDPEDIVALARASARSARKRYRRYRGGREGEVHRRLKEAIAADPEKYLGEPMTLIQTEYPFPTNDRADIVFADQENRPVAVEVEVDVGPGDIPGLLQAVKYRHMLAVLFRLPPDEVRGFLVGRSIAPAVSSLAERYSITAVEVPRIPSAPSRGA